MKQYLMETDEGIVVVYANKNGQIDFDHDSDLGRSNPPKDKWNYPYSYDPFTVYGGKHPEVNGSVYSDRLYQWDGEKYEMLTKKHFPDGVRWANGQRTQAFLREWENDPTLKVTRVIEYCNVSNGFPVWRIDYIHDATRFSK